MLRDRLSLLRRQAGMAPAEPAAALAAPTLPSASPARGSRKAVARVDDATLAERLGGALRAPGVIELRHRFALGHCHGRQTLNGLMDIGADLPGAPAGGDWLFLDTETSGLSAAPARWPSCWAWRASTATRSRCGSGC